jgi:hypothetical protein
MTRFRHGLILVLFGGALAQAQGPRIGTCPVFPADHIWNTPIDTLPVAANSSTLINTISARALAFIPILGPARGMGDL